VTKQFCEQRFKECCHNVCRPVQETCYRECCHQVSKQICETCYKDVCSTQYKCCVDTRYHLCKRCENQEVCYNKTKKHKCGHWETEEYCVPGKKIKCRQECRDICQDPCSCDQNCGRWKTCKKWTCEGPPEHKCRKVWKTHTTCELVPCTKWVKVTKVEKVPYQVSVKVPYTCVQKVPYNVTKCVTGAYVDAQGNAYDCEAPGRCFKEGAVIRTRVPYTVCKTVQEVVKTQVPYTVSRCEKGAYVDEKGCGHECEGPGRTWRAGANIERTEVRTTCRMVQETQVRKVPYTVYRTVQEQCVKQVPYQTCEMVPYTVKKCVPYTVCTMEHHKVCKQVPYKVCKMVPHTVRCKVPYTVTECVPCTVQKKVKVCVPKQVSVKRCRKVAVQEECWTECRTRCDEGGSFFRGLFKRRMCAEPCSNGCDGCNNGCNSCGH
jgi:hypothetical protein